MEGKVTEVTFSKVLLPAAVEFVRVTQLSAAAYLIYSQLPPISGGRSSILNLRTRKYVRSLRKKSGNFEFSDRC